jgi:hypothetical protein
MEGKAIEDNINATSVFFDLWEDNGLKADFEYSDLETFWREASLEYSILFNRALKLVIPFATMHPCEESFFTIVNAKTKPRYTLDLSHR